MEIGFIANAFREKSILITGSTGFLAKILVEKVLRVQPKVKKLYLLVRATDSQSAAQRVQNEVIEQELFHVLREKHGKEFGTFIWEKISPIPGDIIHENLGIEDAGLRELLWKDINMIINVAATTNFYVRYDVALNVNVLGPKHVMKFAKSCSKLEVLLHVSTAYVTRDKPGLLLEKALSMEETLKDNLFFDIDTEIELVERRKKELQAGKPTEDVEKMAMKELGIERARHFGWPNTYVFTKAMAEMLLGQLRGNLPLVIARPTIITSTWRDPIPGWIEGIRDTDSVMDVIPGDMVINAMIAMVVAHSNQNAEFIYHISSSVRNPVNYEVLERSGYSYVAKHPRIGKDGKEIRMFKVPVFKTLDSFHAYLFLRHQLPLEMLRVVNFILCHLFSKKYNELRSKYKIVMRLADLYAPYCFLKGRFDDINLERLRMETRKHGDSHMFDFDPKNIDWDAYFHNIHIPGVIRKAIK
ncbi:hypothetical protein HPP92_000950 [Vanilla planifolia]|uniref:Fatty acyl-CoA reductase n=1 Tax=Vanilla planifolia TaxID=51239 RepID=A0A835S1L5_VANPL|nr:hypothetical protein HPP92_000950 [Vanilla planifolia]